MKLFFAYLLAIFLSSLESYAVSRIIIRHSKKMVEQGEPRDMQPLIWKANLLFGIICGVLAGSVFRLLANHNAFLHAGILSGAFIIWTSMLCLSPWPMNEDDSISERFDLTLRTIGLMLPFLVCMVVVTAIP